MSNQLYIEDIKDIFVDVQLNKIFEDQKTMADVTPKFSISKIKEDYALQKEKDNFNLKEFVTDNFIFPEQKVKKDNVNNESILDRINRLWTDLERKSVNDEGTLIKLPHSYIVPGGRFNEFFYWDSYFVMLGLKDSGHFKLLENIVKNCAYLIENFGFVPNANRTYFLSRSQPPFFALMVQLLADAKEDNNVLVDYLPILLKEYHYWMDGEETLLQEGATKKVVRLENNILLNRYYDDVNEPRPESYIMDVEDNRISNTKDFYRNIRSACESGWDFSSRWFADLQNIGTIETTNILPIDLNCLLWSLENTIYEAAVLKEDIELSQKFLKKYQLRENAINAIFWCNKENIYKDYNYKNKLHTASKNVAMLFPLYFKLSNIEQAKFVESFVIDNLLFDGGLVTTTQKTEQQWDFPNAWAPFQWLGFNAFNNYGLINSSNKLANNWLQLVEKTYNNTSKLMEKYNAVDVNLVAGGGEYPNQDGFGWTNGVYVYLKNRVE